jgi:hypothetical protein
MLIAFTSSVHYPRSSSPNSGPDKSSFHTSYAVFPSIFALCPLVQALSAFATGAHDEYSPCAGVIAMCLCTCCKVRNRHSRVIGMPARQQQLSGQRRFEANLTSSAILLLPYHGAPRPKTHSGTKPVSQSYQTGVLALDLERGFASSSHNQVEVRPSIHDPLLRDHSRSRSPSPASVPEPTRPARIYQGYQPPPVCN